MRKERNFFLKKPRGVPEKCVLQFSNNKMKLSKVPQQNNTELTFVNRTAPRTSYAEQFSMLFSKYYENNRYFSLDIVNINN